MSPSTFEAFQQGIQNTPLGAYLNTVLLPGELEQIFSVLTHPRRIHVFVLNGFFLILIWIYRLRANSRLEKEEWVRKLFLTVWTNLFFLAGALYFVPYYVLGEPYLKTLQVAKRILFDSPQ